MILEIFVVIVLAIWFVVTIFNQFSHLQTIWKFDVFALIPRWTFFAPNPRSFEYEIYYRDQNIDGSTGPWQEVKSATERNLMKAIWNPNRRNRQVLLMLVVNLLRTCRELKQGTGDLKSRPAYSVMLHFLSGCPRTDAAKSRQFMVSRSTDHDSSKLPKILFMSEFFELDDAHDIA